MYTTFASESMGRRINLLFRITMSYLRMEMKKLGIGTGDYSFMLVLFLYPGLSQDELSRGMHVDKSYTARALAKLEKKKLVERRPDPDNHRVKRVFLGQKAVDMQGEIFGVLQNWQDVLVKDIDPQDLVIIREGMDKMLGNAREALNIENPTDNFFGK